MSSSHPNGERGRSELPKQEAWASALCSLRTLKVVLSLMPRAIKVVAAVIEVWRNWNN